ncbi:hypothetical protein GW930_03655 [Candidatus Saccharibacteria bacterium]|nr:hypothetical protein [Candidatus Saccharibacteria bacterium]
MNEDPSAVFHIITYPNNPGYGHNDLFENDEVVYSLDEILDKYTKISKLVLNIPELAVPGFLGRLLKYKQAFQAVPYISINILNQNIRYMPGPSDIQQLRAVANHITQSTAHERYANQSTADTYALPLKHLSVYLDPSQYKRVPIEKKNNLIVYSPDDSAYKDELIRSIKVKMPGYTFKEIRNLKYPKYKQLLERAKFVITFGEGMDGYFIEGAFSGAIPLSVYNSDFFPDSDFLKLPCVFESDVSILKSAQETIVELANSTNFYKETQDKAFDMTAHFYNFSNYSNNIKGLLRGEVDYTPTEHAKNVVYEASLSDISKKLMEHFSQKKDMEYHLQQKDDELYRLKKSIDSLSSSMSELENSVSWRVTGPLRKIGRYFQKARN